MTSLCYRNLPSAEVVFSLILNNGQLGGKLGAGVNRSGPWHYLAVALCEFSASIFMSYKSLWRRLLLDWIVNTVIRFLGCHAPFVWMHDFLKGILRGFCFVGSKVWSRNCWWTQHFYRYTGRQNQESLNKLPSFGLDSVRNFFLRHLELIPHGDRTPIHHLNFCF